MMLISVIFSLVHRLPLLLFFNLDLALPLIRALDVYAGCWPLLTCVSPDFTPSAPLPEMQVELFCSDWRESTLPFPLPSQPCE